VEHRLRCAGAEMTIFEEDTFEVIWSGTGGVPRLINLVCDTALVYGYAEERRTIDRRMIEQVVSDKAQSLTPMGDDGAEDSTDSPPPRDAGAPRTAKRPAQRSTIERASMKKRSAT
jgi:general secretion pathway protein A